MILFLKAPLKDFTFFQPSAPLIVSFLKSSPVAFDGFIFEDLACSAATGQL
jgi:hypothetical protein